MYSILKIISERNDLLVLPNQPIVSSQTASKPKCLDNQAVSFLCLGCQYMKMSQNTVSTLNIHRGKKIIPIFGKVKIVCKCTCCTLSMMIQRILQLKGNVTHCTDCFTLNTLLDRKKQFFTIILHVLAGKCML